MLTGEIVELTATLSGLALAPVGASYVGARCRGARVSTVLAKAACSVVVLAAGSGLGGVLFVADPLNWRTDMYWTSWPILFSDGAILAVVLGVWFFALRGIWRGRKESANQSLETTRGIEL